VVVTIIILLLKALTCYEGAIAIRPDFAIAHGNMGSCQFDLGNVDAAIKTFKHAIQLEVIGLHVLCDCVCALFIFFVFFFRDLPMMVMLTSVNNVNIYC
jgi:tetratricopeptide (TPR) repeat protein